MGDVSYLDGVAKNEPTPEELEKERKKDRESFMKAKHFKNLVESEDFKEVEKVLKDDLYDNLHYPEQHLHMCWGIKMTLERIKLWAQHYDELLKKYNGDI